MSQKKQSHNLVTTISSKILKTKSKKNLFRLIPSLFTSPNNFKTNFWCKLWTKINFVHSWLNLCRNPSIKAKSSQQNMNNYFCKAFSFHFLLKVMKLMQTFFSLKQSILDSFTWRKVFSKLDARNNTIFWGRSWNKYSKILSHKQIILYLRKNNIIFMQSNIEGEGWRPKLRHPFVSIFARCTHVWISAEILNFNNSILSCNILICKHFLLNYPEPWRAGIIFHYICEQSMFSENKFKFISSPWWYRLSNKSMFPTISDIIGLWFVWSVREGNYYKAPAKLTIGRNLVEILRGGRRLLLAHLMSSWEAICQIFTTVGGQRTKETFVKGQTNVFSGQIWKQWDWWKPWWKQWKEKCFAAKLHQ